MRFPRLLLLHGPLDVTLNEDGSWLIWFNEFEEGILPDGILICFYYLFLYNKNFNNKYNIILSILDCLFEIVITKKERGNNSS